MTRIVDKARALGPRRAFLTKLVGAASVLIALSALTSVSSCGDDEVFDRPKDGGGEYISDVAFEPDRETSDGFSCPAHGVPHPAFAPLRLGSAQFVAENNRAVLTAR